MADPPDVSVRSKSGGLVCKTCRLHGTGGTRDARRRARFLRSAGCPEEPRTCGAKVYAKNGGLLGVLWEVGAGSRVSPLSKLALARRARRSGGAAIPRTGAG